MQSNTMQPLTAKELEYIVDSISNEELLIKQCAATASCTQNPSVQQHLQRYIRTHEEHLNALIGALDHHRHLAPTQPQS
ncbi:hypothetical protein Q5741_13375 [Paenibacillus sp. JX-17]|uniref:Spore coat protein n=1 Tax=Paenibacillus lacisoli TaxID=3064525 RepID=A0ABT9CDP5_9BACL|nr:hypothetical protein [Paenibacillus sp. JX-17]MDO7907398.1 hypothetical protein [Paenibacillus sp. JX-17]